MMSLPLFKAPPLTGLAGTAKWPFWGLLPALYTGVAGHTVLSAAAHFTVVFEIIQNKGQNVLGSPGCAPGEGAPWKQSLSPTSPSAPHTPE